MVVAVQEPRPSGKKYLPCPHCDKSIDIGEMKTAIYWSERLRNE